MTVVRAPRRGLVWLSLLVLVLTSVPAGHALGTEVTVTDISTSVLRDDTTRSQNFTFTVTNADANGDSAEIDSISISIPASSNEPFEIQAAVAVGWAGVPTNANGQGGAESVVLSPATPGDGLDPGASLTIRIQVLVRAAATDGQAVTVTVEGTDDNATPVSYPVSFPITIEAAEILPTPTSVQLVEGGSSDTIAVRLAAPPVGSVQVDATIVAAGLSVAAFDAAGTDGSETLTFTENNWNTAQTLTVFPQDDDVGQPNGRSTNVKLVINDDASSNDYDAAPDVAVPVTLVDDDSAGITASAAVLSLTETGTPGTFTVVLNSEPSGSVTLGVTSTATNIATAAPASLTFTSSNWATAQTVTVTPVDDGIPNTAARAGSVSVSYSSGASEYSGLGTSVSVSVADDAHAIVLSHTSGTTRAFEGGASDTFNVALATKPMTNVVIELSLSNPAEATLDTATLTFTPTNWNTPQSVTLTAVDDDVKDAVLSTSITIRATVRDAESDAEYDGVADATLSASIIDNDAAGIVVAQSGGTTVVGENAGERTDTFTVVLTGQPASSVQVQISALVPDTTTASGDVSILPTTLLFSTQNWNIPQQVSISAIDDTAAEGQETVTVQVKVAAGSSAEYLSVPATTFAATINDNDEAGLIITTPTPFVTTEAGGTANFQVRLGSAPASNVVVGLRSDAEAEVTISSGSAVSNPVADGPTHTLTFTPSNWNLDQSVTLTGHDDQIKDGHQDVDIIVSIVDAQSDDRFDGVADRTVTVQNQDNEATVMARPSTVEVDEGDSAEYELSLTVRPASTVTVTVDPPKDVTPSPRTVTFTTDNWATPQTVTVSVADNNVRGGDVTRTVRHSVSSTDSAYDAAQSVSLRIIEDDIIDVARANEDLQDSVKVTRDGDENVVTWDISDVDGDPMGVQIWRSLSPFDLIETFDNETDEYDDEEFRDEEDADALYIVTVYFEETQEGGFFTSRDDLTDVPGYIDLDDDELEDLAIQGEDEGLSDGAIAGLAILGVLIVIAIIVLVIVLVRRNKGDDEDAWDDAWEDPEDPATKVWTDAGWQVDGPAPHMDDSPTPPPRSAQTDEWDEWDEWDDAPVDAPEPSKAAGHGAASELQEEGADDGDDADAWDDDADEWHDEPPEGPTRPDDPQTFHLTCPACRHDFTAFGQKPLVTHCPSCGVEGVLR